jgi:hypothetical protein
MLSVKKHLSARQISNFSASAQLMQRESGGGSEGIGIFGKFSWYVKIDILCGYAWGLIDFLRFKA